LKRFLTPFTFFGFAFFLFINFDRGISHLFFGIGLSLAFLEFLKKNSMSRANSIIEWLAKALGRVWSTIIMLIMYFCIITPVAFLLKLFRRDPLSLSQVKSPIWKQREALTNDLAYFNRGY
jgi:hypothetical protein